MAYATPAELATFLGLAEPPAGAARLLDRASRDVDTATVTAVYDTDTNGAATDPDITAALKAATLEQAAYRLDAGDGTGAGKWADVSIGSAKLGRRTDVTPPAQATAGRLSVDAWQILYAAGLIGQGPW
ncbi:hypothetical protein [Thermomonospora cellulosilytica]|uniref:Head-to-tail adaptor n=1 Tax=Thermomonospora cellulosilytica TaxID=1411118 RepID=A0A7W3MXE1_9ACTN|nr:hypothetical protein [Thermomonospora cellulosilytica]MBA9003665.1 hypothetical protein [Thermomonospora cellulosilytica]